jgi:hypothetical protein
VAYSVIKRPEGPSSKEKVSKGPQELNLGEGTITHCILVILDCPYPLLGQDLLHKLQATISFQEEGTYLETQGQSPIKLLLTCPLSEKYLLSMTKQNPPEPPYLSELRERMPHVWAESNPPGLTNHHAPIVVQLIS